MEQVSCGSVVVYDRLPPLSANCHPWLVAQSLEPVGDDEESNSTGDQFFYTLNDEPLNHYRCRIPELLGRRIRGFFHGWVILSNNVMWCLWNPMTSKIIRLRPLILKDGDSESIAHCCLSFPPDHPSSVLLLTRTDKSSFVFCRLDRKKRRSLRWTEMSYSKQLKKISIDGRVLSNLTCCNGKVYALNTDNNYERFVIQVDIVVVKDREVVINLYFFGVLPTSNNLDYFEGIFFLKGSCTELFCIIVYFTDQIRRIPGRVSLFKLDMTSSVNWELMEGLKNRDMTRLVYAQLEPGDLQEFDVTSDMEEETEDMKLMDMTIEMWEEIVDLKDAMFYVDLSHDYSSYSPSVASGMGGYIHIRSEMGKVIHSYDYKYKTISMSSMPSPVLPTSRVYLWECNRLEDDLVAAECMVDSEHKKNEIVVRKSVSVVDDEVGFNESFMLNFPFDILDMIGKLCVGVDYTNFRASCKRCHLSAPETPLRRLQMYSPWLMMLNKDRNIITLTNPMLGDKYFIKNLPVSNKSKRIMCSKYGWLLFYTDLRSLVFYNPFTSEMRELPDACCTLGGLCFSAPPTSRDCMVLGFSERNVYIHFIAQEPPSWRVLDMIYDVGGYYGPRSFAFSTIHGRDIYVSCNWGKIHVFKDLDLGEKFVVETPRRSSSLYFATKCDLHLLLVIVDEKNGGSVDVFKFNDSTREWEIIDDIGSHMIYICSSTCICIEAKSREMENKIYFPRFRCKSNRMVFYSLETRMYHTFNGKNIGETFADFLGTRYHDLYPDAWIEPTWS